VVPIITQSATSTVTSNPLVLNNVTYKETGVVLEVTPRVNSGGFVTLDINQSVSDVVNTTTSGIDSPTIRQRRLTSTISAKTGQTVPLGGLNPPAESRYKSRPPTAERPPGNRPLFRHPPQPPRPHRADPVDAPARRQHRRRGACPYRHNLPAIRGRARRQP